MVVTKHDIAKQLDFDGGDSQPGASNGRTRRSAVEVTASSARPTRSVRNATKAGTINLEKMTSKSFMNLLGEETSTTAISKNEILKQRKAAEDKLKIQTMLALNAGVAHTDEVEDNSDEGGNGLMDGNAQDVPDRLADAPRGSVRRFTNVPLSPLKNVDKKKHEEEKIIESNIPVVESITQVEQRPMVTEDGVGVNDSALDATIPLSEHTASQTDSCYMLCTCVKCKDFVTKFTTYLNRGYGDDCVNTHEHNAKEMNDSKGSGLLFNTSQQVDDQVLPLFKGCPVNISVTCKGKLKILDKDPNSTDKDYAYAILEDLFEPIVLSNMTSAGKTQGSTKMDSKIKDNILVYLQNKFDGFNMSDLNKHINNKGYCERRKLWLKDSADVRKPMVKNIKKTKDNTEPSDENTNKIIKKKVKKSNTLKRHRDAQKSSPRKLTKKRKHTSKRESSSVKASQAVKVHVTESVTPKKRKVAAESLPLGRSATGGKRPKPMKEIVALSQEESRLFEACSPKKKRKHATTEVACSPTKKRKHSTPEVSDNPKHRAKFIAKFGKVITSTPMAKNGKLKKQVVWNDEEGSEHASDEENEKASEEESGEKEDTEDGEEEENEVEEDNDDVSNLDLSD